jgi:hypothetical protein
MLKKVEIVDVFIVYFENSPIKTASLNYKNCYSRRFAIFSKQKWSIQRVQAEGQETANSNLTFNNLIVNPLKFFDTCAQWKKKFRTGCAR